MGVCVHLRKIKRGTQLWFGQKIPNLYQFSREAAGRKNVELSKVLSQKHPLAHAREDFSKLNPKEIRQFIRISARLLDLNVYNREDALYQAVSAAFGVDHGNDTIRQAEVKEKIIPALMKEPRILADLMGILPKYKAWTASGRHRFMPLALAIVNIFNGKNIFDRDFIPALIAADKSFSYLSEDHPLYCNALGLAKEYLPSYIPELVLPVPAKKPAYAWLDIGSAPKTGGAPTLKILQTAVKSCLNIKFEFCGTDIAMPIFELTSEGEIRHSYPNPAKGN